MRMIHWPLSAVLIVFASFSLGARDDAGFIDRFDVSRDNLASTGRSDYFILEPGYEHVYESADRSEKLVITVLDATEKVDGVQTRVVEEREWHDGRLVEVSRNFFALDRTSGDAYYFGEDVDEYKDGKVAAHGGAWRSGTNGARFGLFMPAAPTVGQKFYQEVAPNVAMDRVEIDSVSETLQVPAGRLEGCVKTNETTPLEAGDIEHKFYAPKVGLVSDGELKLVRHGPRRR